MRRLLPHLALFLCAAATAVAAELVTGDDVRDGTITGADVRDGTLTVRDLQRGRRLPRGPAGARGPAGPTGPTGPTGSTNYAYVPAVLAVVEADGSTQAHGFGITHPGPGVYCSEFPDPDWADVTSRSVDTAQRVSARRYPAGAAPDAPCPAGTTLRVSVEAVSGAAVDGPFSLLVGTG